jgi:hypothetical protein
MGEYRESSPLWKATTTNKKSREDYDDGFAVKDEDNGTPTLVWESWEVPETPKKKTRPNSLGIEDKYKLLHSHRLCYSHEYIGGILDTIPT